MTERKEEKFNCELGFQQEYASSSEKESIDPKKVNMGRPSIHDWERANKIAYAILVLNDGYGDKLSKKIEKGKNKHYLTCTGKCREGRGPQAHRCDCLEIYQ